MTLDGIYFNKVEFTLKFNLFMIYMIYMKSNYTF